MLELKKFIEARVHFGHRTTRWHPKMAPFIWGERNNIHLIDILKTRYLLDQASTFLEGVAEQGLPILWIGTKKAAKDIILDIAKKLDEPHVTNRWIGGTLTNFSQVKKSITKYLHLENVLEKSDDFSYTKKELNRFQKIVQKLRDNVGGVQDLKLPVGAIVMVDIKKDQAAFKEAKVMGVPVVALVDTNIDPTGVDYPIPANDDVRSSISFILNHLADAVAKGKEKAVKKQKAAKEAAEKEKALKEKAAQEKKATAKKAEPKKTDVKKSAPSKEEKNANKAVKPTAVKVKASTKENEDTAKTKKIDPKKATKA